MTSSLADTTSRQSPLLPHGLWVGLGCLHMSRLWWSVVSTCMAASLSASS